ncbi:hypothetical protein U1Q18_046717 [Sarracenia purpurea var. burkii]
MDAVCLLETKMEAMLEKVVRDAWNEIVGRSHMQVVGSSGCVVDGGQQVGCRVEKGCFLFILSFQEYFSNVVLLPLLRPLLDLIRSLRMCGLRIFGIGPWQVRGKNLTLLELLSL